MPWVVPPLEKKGFLLSLSGVGTNGTNPFKHFKKLLGQMKNLVDGINQQVTIYDFCLFLGTKARSPPKEPLLVRFGTNNPLFLKKECD